MLATREILSVEENGTLSFGDYELAKKTKREDFEFQGDLYKVKTFKEITKLERNGMFVYESVPGTQVSNFSVTDDEVSFEVASFTDVQLTIELEPEQAYVAYIDGVLAGDMITNLGGKLSISVELANKVVKVEIRRK